MGESVELSKYEELIYNTHLKTSRTHMQQPFRYRKDFTGISQEKANLLKKLSHFFNKFRHIDMEDFFLAPYKVYKDETYFDLSYYTTLKAIKAYTIYQQQLEQLEPDSSDQLKNIQKSLIYINQFCTENNITLSEYLFHKTNIAPSFTLHLKEHKVNIYTLLGLTKFSAAVKNLDPDLTKFTLGESFYNNIDVFRTKLLNSKKAIILVQKGLQKINDNLQKKP